MAQLYPIVVSEQDVWCILLPLFLQHVLRASCSSARRRRPTIRRRDGQRVRRREVTSSNCSSGTALLHIVQTCFSKDLSVKLKYGDDRDGQADREANAAEMTDQQEAEELEKEEPKGWGIEHPDLYVWPDHGYVICSKFWLKGGQEAWYLGVPVGLSISFQTTI